MLATSVYFAVVKQTLRESNPNCLVNACKKQFKNNFHKFGLSYLIPVIMTISRHVMDVVFFSTVFLFFYFTCHVNGIESLEFIKQDSTLKYSFSKTILLNKNASSSWQLKQIFFPLTLTQLIHKYSSWAEGVKVHFYWSQWFSEDWRNIWGMRFFFLR